MAYKQQIYSKGGKKAPNSRVIKVITHTKGVYNINTNNSFYPNIISRTPRKSRREVLIWDSKKKGTFRGNVKRDLIKKKS